MLLVSVNGWLTRFGASRDFLPVAEWLESIDPWQWDCNSGWRSLEIRAPFARKSNTASVTRFTSLDIPVSTYQVNNMRKRAVTAVVR